MHDAAQVERLLEELGARARCDIEQALRDARARAESALRENEAGLASRRGEALLACERDERAAHRRAEWEARLAARARLLRAQHALVARVFSAARALALSTRCPDIDSTTLRDRLSRLLAYVDTEGAGAEIRCSPSLAPAIARVFASDAEGMTRAGVVADESVVLGARLVGEGGRVVVDDTFDAWLASEGPALTIEICTRAERCA